MIVIETDRLYLRRYKEDDFEGLHAIFSDPETMTLIKNIGPKDSPLKQPWLASNMVFIT